MNDLGLTLGWLALRVGVLLVPAIGLHALASRRGPASGAWAATLALGMVVGLPFLTLLPWNAIERPEPRVMRPPIEKPAGVAKAEPVQAAEVVDRASSVTDQGREIGGFRLAWARFERGASGPVARFRPWGKIVAWVALAGSGVGLIRLGVGLWAVALCRRRGRLVVDPGMVELVEELRREMGCERAIELREVADLTTPATAGWFRPMLLLPRDWQGWDEPERRAVVAHELAHVIRGDYASGLLARVAVVLNYYHPMVRWLAARLHLEQELAADAMGARFAGGRSSYLLALSRLALEQDGSPASWPARAFLPVRGTLIRRITMLKDDHRMTGPTWSKPKRLATALGLLALTIGVATFKAPSSVADDKPSPAPTADPKANPAGVAEVASPFEIRYIPDSMNGFVGFRPAATVRRSGMGMLTSWLRSVMAEDLADLAKGFKVDTTRPGFVKLRCEDIESVTCGVKISKWDKKGAAKVVETEKGEEPTGRLEYSGFTVRAVAPFDWLGYLRQWTLELEEVRESRGVYYQINGPIVPDMPLSGYGVYLPDDRTIVIDEAKWIKKLIARESPTGPTYVQGKDWERVSRDLVAVALNNRDDALSKDWDPDQKKVPSFIKGVDRLVIGLADLDSLSPRWEVTARDASEAVAVVHQIQLFATLGLAQLGQAPGKATEFEPLVRLGKGFLANVKVESKDRTVTASSEGFGSFADLGAFFQEAVEGGLRVKSEKPKAEEAKADPKAEKR